MSEVDTWPAWAAANRERIETSERELVRLRDRIHKIEADTAAIRFLTEKVSELAMETREIAEQVTKMSRHFVNRPTSGALNALANFGALAVSIVALVVVASH